MNKQSDYQIQDLNERSDSLHPKIPKESAEEKRAKNDAQILKNRARYLQNQKLFENIKSHQLDRKLKEDYAERIFNYLYVYSAVVLFILLVHGFFGVFGDWVLVALIGSIATGVFTSVNAVMKGLFGSEK